MVALHNKIKIPFNLTISNYTTRIQSNLYDITFLKNAKSSRTFAAYAKLKRDVKNLEPKSVDMKRLKYYQTGFNFQNGFADEIQNVDIKSAYATILFNEGILSQDTFDYLSKLPKQERLSSVGMLAGRKNVFEYSNGEIVSSEEIKSPYSSFFFYAVQKTYDIMDEVKRILGENFAFSWVDGIYFEGKENAKAVQELLLNKFNLKSSHDVLTNFEIESRKEHWKLSYTKENERKFFYIPFPQMGTRQSLYNHLLTKTFSNETT